MSLQPGQKVCRIHRSFGATSFHADVVRKVYKNGNVTLESDPTGQYRVHGDGTGTKIARGYSSSSTHVRPMDEEAKRMIAEDRINRRRNYLAARVKNRVALIPTRGIVEDLPMLEALEAVLDAHAKEEGS